jgi:hypothetical protein
VTEVFIRFPVRCPVCKQEWTSQQTKGEILDALDNDHAADHRLKGTNDSLEGTECH